MAITGTQSNGTTSQLPSYGGQLVNGFAPVAGYSNSNPTLQAGNKEDPTGTGGQSAINPPTAGYINGPAAPNQGAIDSFTNSLSSSDQVTLKAMSNQFGGDVLATAKFMGIGTSGGQDNPLYDSALKANTGSSGGTSGSATPQTSALITGAPATSAITTPTAIPTNAATLPTGNPPVGTPGQGMANSGTANAIASGTPKVDSTGSASLGSKYGATLSNLQGSGTTAPTTAGAGSAAVAGASPAPTNPTTQPDSTQAQVVLDSNQAYQKYISDYQQSQSSGNQQTSLEQDFTSFQNQLGLPAMQTQLMNMKNVINGTDNDIRNEISKAGGFATNSQVQAMAVSRNSALVGNYNDLLQTYTDASNQVNTMIGLDEKDKAMAQQKISDQLSFDKQMVDYTQKAVANAQSSLTDMQKTEGWDGVLKAAQVSGDPEAIAKINSTMGNGFDLAIMASQDATNRSTQAAKDATAQKQADLNLTKTGADIVNTEENTAKTASDIKKQQEDMNDANGVPNPAKADQPGYSATGVKYTVSSATNELQNEIKTQGMMGDRKLLAPSDYNQMKAWWVANNLSDKDFDSEFGGYKDTSSKTKALYN